MIGQVLTVSCFNMAPVDCSTEKNLEHECEDTNVKNRFHKYKFDPLIKMGRIISKSDLVGDCEPPCYNEMVMKIENNMNNQRCTIVNAIFTFIWYHDPLIKINAN
jgi:hypothetical protein